MDHELTVTGLSFGYRDSHVLHEVTLPPVRSGQVTALIGPNAAGKSTLLRCIAGLHRISAGRIHLRPATTTNGPAHTIRPAPQANPPLDPDQAFYLPQETPPASSLSVFEAVLLAHAQATRRRGAAARAAERDTAQALTALNLDGLATRPIAALSGGQRQLVGLAQAVARRPALLLLDEPTSNLDLRNQLRILALIRQLATHQPAAVLVTIHDLNHAARFADKVVVLHNGTVHAAGPPHDVITPAMLRAVYKVDGHVHRDQDQQITVTAHHSL